MRVLVTGHRGYVGSVLTCILRHARFDVVGLDCDLYRDCDFGRMTESIPSFETDVRDIQFADLVSFDAIVHLAAFPEIPDHAYLSKQIARANQESTLLLAERARQANVPRFILASSNTVYGRSATHVFDEDDVVNPASTAAASNRYCEEAVMRLADSAFSPVVMRIGEVFGVSPRLRLDRPVNDLIASAVTQGRIAMNYGTSGWRSLIHVEDLCRMIVGILKASLPAIHARIFNTTRPDEHHRIVEIADMIMQMMPFVTRTVAADIHDPASLRSSGAGFIATFPEFRHRWNLVLGIRQLQAAFSNSGFSPGDWRSDRYRRNLHVLQMFEQRKLDATLRMVPSAHSPTPIKELT